MSVSRSALASSAARSASAASAPMRSATQRRDAPHAPDAIALAAELAVVDDLVERRNARLERALPVLVEEELRVGQARPDDALVAFDDARRVGRRDVADDEEAVGEPAVRLEQRKVLLVRLHRQDQAFRRHGEELRVELAGEHVRPLDQRGDFVEQRVVVDRREAGRRGGRIAAGARISARRSLEARRSRRLRRAAAPRSSWHRAARSARGCLRSDGRASSGPASRPSARTGTTVVAVQRDQPVRRANEAHARPAVGELVLHDLRDRQLRERAIEDASAAPSARLAPGRRRVEEQRLALAFDAPLQASAPTAASAPSAAELLRAAPASPRPLAVKGRRSPASACARLGAVGGALGTASISTASRRGVAYDVQPRHPRLEQLIGAQAGGDARRRTPCRASAAPSAAAPRRTARPAAAAAARSPSGRLPRVGGRAAWPRAARATSSAHAFGAIGKPSRARLSR